MSLHFFSNQLIDLTDHPLIADLQTLYAQMDQEWERVARQHGFVCRGCDDNCCQTFFFHHTHIECTLLYTGFQRLSPDMQQFARQRAAMPAKADPATARRQMCPLNRNGRCMVYRQRPMICRLHGLPHRFPKAGGYGVGPGCEAFYQAGATGNAPLLERTPLYLALARIESRFKQALGLTGKFRMTVAQMICQWPTAKTPER